MSIPLVPLTQVNFDLGKLLAEMEPVLRASYPTEPDFNALARGTELYGLVNPGPILDIGANIGISAVGFRRVGLTARVHCFEPNRFLTQVLKQILDQIGNVDVQTIGFSDTAGSMMLYVPFVDGRPIHQEASVRLEQFSSPFIESRLRGYGNSIELAAIEAEIRTVDSLRLDPTFIKIDVEGAEALVLQGAASTLDRCRPILHIENGSLAETETILTAMDYDWFCFEHISKVLLKSADHYNRYWIPCEKLRRVGGMLGAARGPVRSG